MFWRITSHRQGASHKDLKCKSIKQATIAVLIVFHSHDDHMSYVTEIAFMLLTRSIKTIKPLCNTIIISLWHVHKFRHFEVYKYLSISSIPYRWCSRKIQGG